MRRAGPVAIGAALLIMTGAVRAGEPLAVSVQRLTMESALKAAQVAIATCRAQGLQVGVTVMDRGGHPQVVLRDVLAPDLTLRVSRAKAYTALSFNAATSALQRQSSSGLARMPGLMFEAGGVPIAAGGVLYGAIGVSGAPLGTGDESCARAGAQAIESDLDLM